METRIYIVGQDKPLYVSKKSGLGFLLDATPVSIYRSDLGDVHVSFSVSKPLYVYDGTNNQIFVSGHVPSLRYYLLAQWLPQKVTA